MARVWSAVVNVRLTIIPGKAWLAITRITVDTINASGAISTWVGNALVIILFTSGSRCALKTSTLIAVDQINTLTTILTWVGRALIDRHVAVAVCVARKAVADVGIQAVDTGAIVTVDADAVVSIDLAINSAVPFLAITTVTVDVVVTFTTILTRTVLAFINVNFTP